jgi:hypothetical protein
MLQLGQGIPAPPQPQAYLPDQGRSGWVWQTHRVPLQTKQAIGSDRRTHSRLFCPKLPLLPGAQYADKYGHHAALLDPKFFNSHIGQLFRLTHAARGL